MVGSTYKLVILQSFFPWSYSTANKIYAQHSTAQHSTAQHSTAHMYEFPSCSYTPVIGPKEHYITNLDVLRYTKLHGNNVSQPHCYTMESMPSKAPHL